jgi:hypothetical protein
MKICTFEDCLNPYRSKGLCQAHYQQRRSGKELVSLHPKRCSFDGCNSAHKAKGLCSMHYARLTRTGDASTVRVGKQKMGPESLRWGGDDITYDGFHRRLRRTRGLASTFQCVGCSKQAAHWAYDHTDPSEVKSSKGPFSTDLDRYQPMCVPCHKRFDTNCVRVAA